ncbi:NAD-dependent epimerase/dehydratase family protein [Enterococcus faecalis]|nr:NAD-dependent epimerase/dehydratase family protein [Enterococcus faecalis]
MSLHSNIYQKKINYIIKNYPHWSKLKNKTVLITQLSKTTNLLIEVLMNTKIVDCYNISVIVIEEHLNKFKKSNLTYNKSTNFHVYPEELCYIMINSEKIDYIIHQEKYTDSLNESIISINQVLLWAHYSQVTKLIYLSSTKIYGIINNLIGEPIKEQRFGYLNCNTPDSLSIEKIRINETICQAYISKYNINVVIMRLAPLFTTVSPPLLIIDSSKKERKKATAAYFCHISDAVSAILHLLTNGDQGQAYNVASPSEKLFLDNQTSLVNIDTTKMKNLGWVGLYMVTSNH